MLGVPGLGLFLGHFKKNDSFSSNLGIISCTNKKKKLLRLSVVLWSGMLKQISWKYAERKKNTLIGTEKLILKILFFNETLASFT